jgi:tetratricopeptide (TPR) repeat protein
MTSSPQKQNPATTSTISLSSLTHRAALEPEDFDVTTDEAIPLRNKSRAAALDEDAGGAGGGGGDSSAINNPNNPASRTATASGKPLHVPYAPTIRCRTGVVDIMQPLVLKDYILLAEACKRAGRARVEATAYFKIAHILSTTDEEERPKAVVYLRKYLQICRRINDLQGEAKALNALGIVHYEIALSTCTQGSTQAEMLLRIALGFHRQHAEIADAAGIFIANTNAGLCHAHLGDHAAAAESHKLAASFAVQAGDRDAEALALSNLAAAAASTGDLATSRLCAQRQLDVGNATHNPGVACEAQEQLAQLAIQRSDYAAATGHLVAALEIALREGDQRRALRLRCQLGVAHAANAMEGRMHDCSSNMESHLQ